MVTLYQLERCPWCAAVRQAIRNVGIDDYRIVNVPHDREKRTAVTELTGQPRVPVLVDGDQVIWDSRRIVRHLYAAHGGPERARSIAELPDDVGGQHTVKTG